MISEELHIRYLSRAGLDRQALNVRARVVGPDGEDAS